MLFTTSGMHPLTPYLLGRPHPLGRRLTNLQRCLRTTDLDDTMSRLLQCDARHRYSVAWIDCLAPGASRTSW